MLSSVSSMPLFVAEWALVMRVPALGQGVHLLNLLFAILFFSAFFPLCFVNPFGVPTDGAALDTAQTLGTPPHEAVEANGHGCPPSRVGN